MLEIFAGIAGIADDLKKVEEELRVVTKFSDPFIMETTNVLLGAGGKRIRPICSLLGAKFYEYDLEKVLPLAVALEIFHMATLVHDDVVDASLTRRGNPTVVALWGNRVSTHLGNYLLAKSLILFSKYKNPLIPRVMSEVSVKICEGEIYQIVTVQDYRQSIKEYFYRIHRKTALLLSASCQLGAVACDSPASIYLPLRRYGHYIGMAFQIVDDVLDLTASKEKLGKPVGSDLRQGIITLPIIFSLKYSPFQDRIRQIVSKEIKTEEEIREVVDLVSNHGLKKSMEVAYSYTKKAKKELDLLPDVPSKEILAKLADFVCTRQF